MITNRPITLLSTLSQVFPTSDEIFIACAYVSPVACEKLFLSKIGDQKPVSIIIGRAIDDGLTPAAIYYFTQLNKLLSKNGGGVRLGDEPFHSKLYVCKTGPQIVPRMDFIRGMKQMLRLWTTQQLLKLQVYVKVCFPMVGR